MEHKYTVMEIFLRRMVHPIGKYLPDYVKVPTYNGQMITNGNLDTHTSGLPHFPIG